MLSFVQTPPACLRSVRSSVAHLDPCSLEGVEKGVRVPLAAATAVRVLDQEERANSGFRGRFRIGRARGCFDRGHGGSVSRPPLRQEKGGGKSVNCISN